MPNLLKCASALLGLGLLAAVACHDLTEVPYTEVTDQNYKPTAKDLGSVIAPAYTPLRNLWLAWYGNIDTQEESSDELLTPVRPNGWYDGGTYIRMHQHRWDSHQGQPQSLYGNAFDGINGANRVIYEIESGAIPVDDETKVKIPAEMRALRAYNYSLLLDNFGNVPIVTDFTSADLPEQSTRQQVYDFVVKELTDAIPNLSEEVGVNKTYGRMTKWAALAILARVELNAEVYTGTPHYDEVIANTQQIIDGGKFKLEANYRTPFSRTNFNSVENIWAVPYDAINAPESSFHMKTLKPDLKFVLGMQSTPWGGSASNPQFIDTYDPADKRLPDTWLIGPHFDGAGHGYDFVKFVPSISETEFDNGYPVWKYEIYAGENGSSDVDYPIVRYAEVLMMKAEALLRTGHADDAAAIVTEVRQRDFPTDPSKATVTGAQLLQGSSYNYGWSDTDGVVKTAAGGTPVVNGGGDVRFGRFFDELGWEFAAEGHRRSDMIRFGVYTHKTWFNHVPLGDYHALFPIPFDALNTNTKLQQNPGY